MKMLLQNNNSIISSTKHFFYDVTQKKFLQCLSKKVHTETIKELRSIAKECQMAYQNPVVLEMGRMMPFENPNWRQSSPKEILEPLLVMKGGNLAEALNYESPYGIAKSVINSEWKFSDVNKALYLFLSNGVGLKSDEAMEEIERSRFDLVHNERDRLYEPKRKSLTVEILFNATGHAFLIQTWIYRSINDEVLAGLWGSTSVSYVMLKMLLGDYEFRMEELKFFFVLFRYAGVLSPSELYSFTLGHCGSTLSLMMGKGYLHSQILHYSLGIKPAPSGYDRLREFHFTRENNFPYASELWSREDQLLFLASIARHSLETGDFFLTSVLTILKQTPRLT